MGLGLALQRTHAFHARLTVRRVHRNRTRTVAMATNERASQRAAVGQMCASNDIEANLKVVETLCRKAYDQQCSMLFLPECFAYIGVKCTDALEVMGPVDGRLLRRYASLAVTYGLWLSLGGFAETGPDANHRYNAHVIIDDTGTIKSKYRKIHLFDVDMGVVNGPVLMESRHATAGNTLSTCLSPVGKLGLTVCYDLRFPEMYNRLRHELGCEILLVPSAFTKPTGEAHWEVLLRARAIETQCYVIAAAQAGVHSEGRASYGHSLIIDPWGKVVAEMDGTETGIAVADIDLDYVKEIRERIPVSKHRQPIDTFDVLET